MISLTINKELKAIIPSLELGVIELDNVQVSKSGDRLWADMQEHGQVLTRQITTTDEISRLPAVEATRSAYKLLGNDPSRYRGSAEALIRRLLTGKSLYRINNVVDINNLISLICLCPVGSYDSSRIHGDIVFRPGRNKESYKGIGKEIVSLDGIPVFCDTLGPFGSPTSDSERTMILGKTTSVLTIVISFGGLQEPMSQQMKKFSALYREYLPDCFVSTSVVT